MNRGACCKCKKSIEFWFIQLCDDCLPPSNDVKDADSEQLVEINHGHTRFAVWLGGKDVC